MNRRITPYADRFCHDEIGVARMEAALQAESCVSAMLGPLDDTHADVLRRQARAYFRQRHELALRAPLCGENRALVMRGSRPEPPSEVFQAYFAPLR